jgi:hypothetical protein
MENFNNKLIFLSALFSFEPHSILALLMCMFENDSSNYWFFSEGGTLFADDVVFTWSHIIFRNVLDWCANFIFE